MPLRGPVPVVTSWEYGPVVLPRGLDTPATRERLEAAALRTGVNAFEVRGRRLYARGAVGVIDVGNVIVEILPKTREQASPSDGAAFLGDLLRFTGSDDDLGLSDAGIAAGEGGLLEVVLGWAARSAARNLREGAPRRYAVREELSTAVRGRIQLGRMVRQRPGRACELTIRHAPLSDDNPISQLVRWLVSEIGARTRSLKTRALCLQLLPEFKDVAYLPPELDAVDRIVLSPLEMQWAPLMNLARLFLAQGRPDPARGGQVRAVAVLFTLHDLFESAVRRVLALGLDGDLRLRRPNERLLRPMTGGSGLINLKPDFLLGRPGSPPVLVGDAKWKRVVGTDGALNLRESDAYQLVAYVSALDTRAGFLVCPLGAEIDDRLIRSSWVMAGLDRPIEVIGLNLPGLIAPSAEGAELRDAFCATVTGLTDLDAPADLVLSV